MYESLALSRFAGLESASVIRILSAGWPSKRFWRTAIRLQPSRVGKPPFEPNASKMGFPPIWEAKRRQNSIILPGRAIPWPRVRLSNGSAAIVAASH